MTKTNKFDFLSSTRFWALVAIAVVGVMDKEGIISSIIAQSLATILGGFVVIRTADRFSEKIGGIK